MLDPKFIPKQHNPPIQAPSNNNNNLTVSNPPKAVQGVLGDSPNTFNNDFLNILIMATVVLICIISFCLVAWFLGIRYWLTWMKYEFKNEEKEHKHESEITI